MAAFPLWERGFGPRTENVRAAVAAAGPGAGPVVVELNDGRERGGIFRLPAGAVLEDALKAAGVPDRGAFPQASLKASLASGMSIVIRRTAAGKPEAAVGAMTAATRLALDLPIDVNAASSSDLVLIPGIGPKTAEKIVVLRQERTRFRSLDELAAVKGIKDKRLERFRKYLYVDATEAAGRRR
jgi:competence protein ComEA